MNNITIYDIAAHFNVNASTVNRALNDKPGVGEDTRRKIKEYALEAGYKTNKVAKSLSRKPIKIGFVLNDVIPDFWNEVYRGVHDAYEEMSDFNIEFESHVCKSSEEYLYTVDKMADSGVNGILTIPLVDMPELWQVFSKVRKKKIAVANIVNDVNGIERNFVVRLDGKLTGSISAELLWWFTGGGRVAIFTGNKKIGILADIIEGFVNELQEKPMELLKIYENYDEPALAELATERLLEEYPDINGLFISTANSSAVCRKIKEKGMAGKIRIIAMDIFPELKEYIKEGVVHASIFQNPYMQGNQAFKKLYRYLDGEELTEEEVLIKPQIVLKSNLSQF